MAAVKKYSKQREAVLNNLSNRYDHPSADEVYTSLRNEHPNISLGTVYRNLNSLVENGQVAKFSYMGKEHYDGHIEPHYHFICEKCGKIYDVFDVSLDEFLKSVSDSLECEVDTVQIVINGICKNCRKII